MPNPSIQNLWDESEAREFSGSDLELRVYTSRLLGRNEDLVLHGGGNTSVKTVEKNIFGEDEEILYVKGSGWDLKTIEAAGFSPARLKVLQRLATLETMTDTQMTHELKASLTDPAAPSPSVEAILHAIIPFKFVDHTHTDAVVAISNTNTGGQVLQSLYGDDVLVLPYVMPGFVLARQIWQSTRDIDWKKLKGIVLLHHGLFTFSDDARESYSRMIELVAQAEDHLGREGALASIASATCEPRDEDYVALAEMRRTASSLFGHPMLARWKKDAHSVGFSSLAQLSSVANRGPLTPDHTIHTKRIPAIINHAHDDDLRAFERDYREYFKEHSGAEHTCLDPAPRYAIWKNKGCIVFAANHKRAGIISDISDHTMKAIQWAESLGGWKALSEKEIFDLEYWELEQAKLKRAASRGDLDGKIVLVSGAASGIGLATVRAFLAGGACVVGLDIDPGVVDSSGNYLGLECDVTSSAAITHAIQQGVARFGGIDILVSNAGAFPSSCRLDALSDDALEKSLALNFSSHQKLIREAAPFLKLGFDASIVIVASKNVPAPGPGAGAYSTAKAALTQMARVAALELGPDGIRVNVIHPNAVFDTGVWTEEVLEKRAGHYGLSVEAYKTNNVMKVEVTSGDVAAMAVTMSADAFGKTTGAQVAVDGGNERVI
jgi:rhamnose utilization protein RhaD (predicted bifunctional aldolase and dehydrogenase)/NAD(P)-dependent dehydrogenase (short-subunit alcohol dehydrogenase family)